MRRAAGPAAWPVGLALKAISALVARNHPGYALASSPEAIAAELIARARQ